VLQPAICLVRNCVSICIGIFFELTKLQRLISTSDERGREAEMRLATHVPKSANLTAHISPANANSSRLLTHTRTPAKNPEKKSPLNGALDWRRRAPKSIFRAVTSFPNVALLSSVCALASSARLGSVCTHASTNKSRHAISLSAQKGGGRRTFP